MDKQEYIGKYLEKKLKNCKLPYGMQYLSLVSELTNKAEELWIKQNKMDLRLSLIGKWFLMTKELIKGEDYRSLTPYWYSRFCLYKGEHKTKKWWAEFLSYAESNILLENMTFKQFTTNTMTLGYPSNSDKERIITFEHKGIEIGYGKEELGAEPNKLYFIIKHGELKHNK